MPGDIGDLVGEGERADARRNPASDREALATPPEKQDDPQPEGGKAPRHQTGDQGRVIDHRPCFPGSKQAKDDPQKDREDLACPDQQQRVPQPLHKYLGNRTIRMVADPQLSPGQVAEVEKELRLERIDPAVPRFDRVQRLKAVDNWFVEPKADPHGLLIFLLEAGVMRTGLDGIPGQHAEQKKIQDDDKQNGECRPADLLQQGSVAFQGFLRAHGIRRGSGSGRLS